MIIRMLIKCFTTIIDGIAFLFAKLLVELGLWLSAIYVIIFLLSCAVMGVSLSGTIKYWFFLGLFVSAGLGIYLEYSRGRFKKNIKEKPKKSLFGRYLERRKNQKNDLQEETPLIFASRRDPNLLIYEFSDRLEFYRKSVNGIDYVETRYKELKKKI